MKEKFMLIENYPNYAVSNKGNVMTVTKQKLLNINIDKAKGYPYLQLSKNGQRKTFRVHKLVALAFVDNPENKPYVNHIDGNKTNNYITNLEWVTAQENTLHAQINHLKNDNKPVMSVHLGTGERLVFNSIGECATYFNTNKGSIHRVLTGKRNKFKGYCFEYVSR